MTHDRKRVHKDANHNPIKEELIAYGYEVDDVCAVPGLYDMVVTGLPSWSTRAVSCRVEIKSPGGKLTEAEQKYHDKFHFDNLLIAYSTDDILRWFGRG